MGLKTEQKLLETVLAYCEDVLEVHERIAIDIFFRHGADLTPSDFTFWLEKIYGDLLLSSDAWSTYTELLKIHRGEK